MISPVAKLLDAWPVAGYDVSFPFRNTLHRLPAMGDTSSGAKRCSHHDGFRDLLFRRTSLDSSLRVIGNAVRTLRCDGYAHSDQLTSGKA